jgi:ubiquitin-activating enzyme E1
LWRQTTNPGPQILNPGPWTLNQVRHGLEDGDYVSFSEVGGMEELNTAEPMQIKTVGPYAFSIIDTSKMGKHTNGGYFKQVNTPPTLNPKP